MTRPRSRSVAEAFSRSPARTRLHVKGRLATVPLEALVEALGPARTVVDLGCGHGVVSLALALARPDEVEVRAVDIDAGKVGRLSDAARHAGVEGSVRAEVVDPTWRPAPASADAVIICDVLYLMGEAAAASVVVAAAAALRDGGRLVIAEVDPAPGWRRRVARVQELIAVHLLRMTRGSTVTFRPPDTYARWMTDAGLAVERRDPPRRGLLRHGLVVGRARA